jgi:hypothetical protein
MNYAQIKNGQVENIIVLEDDSLIAHFSEGFDYFVAVDGIDPMPRLGWAYDGTKFIPTAPVPLNQQSTPTDFGLKLMQIFSQYNISRGLTSTQRLQIAQVLSPYATMVQSGDLQGFVDVAGSIPVDGVLITQVIIDGFTSQITNYLAGGSTMITPALPPGTPQEKLTTKVKPEAPVSVWSKKKKGK